MNYTDSDFNIINHGVMWIRGKNVVTRLHMATQRDIYDLIIMKFAGKVGVPVMYVLDCDITNDMDVIYVFDSKGNQLHSMEDENGLHRGADQEVHGSSAGASSGSQSTGTSITGTTAGVLVAGGYTVYSSLGAGYIPGSGAFGTLQATSKAMTVSGSTPGYAFNYYGGTSGMTSQQAMLALAQASQNNYTLAGPIYGCEQQKIKDDGIKVGEIIAYRCWPIKYGFLWSTAAGRAWAPGEPMKAGENHLRDGLGVYAFKEMSRCISEFDNDSRHGEGMAFGTIHIWGEIIEHQHGYRAEYAAIRSIEFVRGRAALSELRSLYKVEGK